MPEIVLTDEQAKVVHSSLKPIVVKDSQGIVLAVIPPIWTEEDIAAAKHALATSTTWYTTEQVMAHLRSLEKEGK
jgi:hypothetical protein